MGVTQMNIHTEDNRLRRYAIGSSKKCENLYEENFVDHLGMTANTATQSIILLKLSVEIAPNFVATMHVLSRGKMKPNLTVPSQVHMIFQIFLNS